jgi:hypothetical protein
LSGGSREVIFEFIPAGTAVKASAVDVLTGIEVSIMGPAGPASQRELQRVALLKLKQRLVREGYAVGNEAPAPAEKSKPAKDDPDEGSGGGLPSGGIIV